MTSAAVWIKGGSAVQSLTFDRDSLRRTVNSAEATAGSSSSSSSSAWYSLWSRGTAHLRLGVSHKPLRCHTDSEKIFTVLGTSCCFLKHLSGLSQYWTVCVCVCGFLLAFSAIHFHSCPQVFFFSSGGVFFLLKQEAGTYQSARPVVMWLNLASRFDLANS